MKKMNFNIQMFGEDGSFNPAAYNKMIESYDSDIPAVNQAFVANQDAMQVFKSVAGSPKLSEQVRGLINGLNTSIEETVNYFDSVKRWAAGVSSVVSDTLGTNLSNASSSIDRTVIDMINENYNNGRVGISNFASADTYISGIKESATKLRGALSSITSDVGDASDSLPNSVSSALNSRISTNNDNVLAGYDKLTEYLSTNVEEFKTQLQGAIDDMASAANSAQ